MDRAKILIVEDEAIIATDLRMRLQGMDYDVPEIVASGEEAINKASELEPDLILMDIMLFGPMDGIDAANIIQSKTDIPIIYVTAYADEDILERAKITEPFGYMIKPISDRELRSNIELTLYKHNIDVRSREREKWHSTVLSSIGDAVITTDTQGRLVYMNPAAELLTGWKSNEVTKKNVEEVFNLVSTQTGEKVPCPVRSVLDRGIPSNLEDSPLLIKKDGSLVPVDDSCAPIKDEKGRTKGAVLAFADITERKKAEDAQRKSEEQIRLLLNSTAEAIYGLDTEGKCTFCNPSCLTLLGYDKEEDLLGKKMHELIHHTHADGRTYPASDCKIHKVLEDGKKVHIEDEILWRSDDSSFYAEYRAQPVFVDGRINGAVVTFLDISKRRKAEKFIRNILESVGEGFIVVDRNFRIISANKAFSEQVNMPIDEILGKRCHEVSHHMTKPCYEVGEQCPVKHTFETGEPQVVVHNHLDKEGNPSYSEVRSYAMKDESGEVISVIESIINRTEQKKLESQLRHAQKMEAIGHLAGGIAHDFNNILTAIVGYGNIVKMKMEGDDPLQIHLKQILESTERAANLTQNLLAFSRKQIMSPVPVSFNRIVENVTSLLKRLISEDISFHTYLTDKDATVMADAGQIEQVLMNLATNARDAMPEGGSLTITTERVDMDDDYIKKHGFGTAGSHVLVSVTDTGLGMDNYTRAKIFEPFFTTKELGKGTGLGLATSYGIIKQHNGFLNVYSEPGEGTTFRIYLPAIKAETSEAKKPEATVTLGGSETVLVAEDDLKARKLTTLVLDEFGYKVIEAVDGDDAIEKFNENKDSIKLLLLDVIMPKKNGKEVYEEIHNSHPDIKSLFISGYTADIIHKKGVIEKDLNFMSKPYSPQDLLKKIREILDGK